MNPREKFVDGIWFILLALAGWAILMSLCVAVVKAVQP